MSAQPYTPEELVKVRACAVFLGVPANECVDRLLATVDALTSRLDAATRRADNLWAMLVEAREHVVSNGWDHDRERYTPDAAELLAKIDAALSTGSTPATTANPGDKEQPR